MLVAAYESACAGNLELVLIGGEAGIGKTTLVEHVLANPPAIDARALRGACYDLSSTPPYALWSNVLDDLLEETDWIDSSREIPFSDQDALFQEIRRRLAELASGGPVIVVLEDAHWADQESMELLRHIGQRVRDVQLLIIVTYRDDEIRTGEPFYEALLPLVRECGARRIDLRSLQRPDISEMVRARYSFDRNELGRLVDILSRRSGGNPLFIVELLRSMEMSDLLRQEDDSQWRQADHVARDIPRLVQQLIDRRLRQLDPDALELLQTAAIAGFEIRPALLVAVTGRAEDFVSDALQQAIKAALLEQSPDRLGLRFRHALIHEALYESTPILWRQARHRAIAETLAEQPGPDAAAIAEHFRVAGDHRAVSWSILSARNARRLFAPNAVIQQLGPVMEFPEDLAIEVRIEVYGLRGWAFEMIGSFDQANSDYHAELRWAQEAGDHPATRDALVRLAELWTYRDYQRVVEYVEQALRVTEDINDQPLLAQTHNRFGTWYLSQDEPVRARAHHQRALDISEHIADASGIAQSHDLLGLALSLSGNLVSAARQHQHAQAHFRETGDQQGLANCLANVAHLGPTMLADAAVPALSLDDCIREGEEALRYASSIDYRSGLVYARVRLIACLGARGDYQRALDMVHQNITDAEQIGNQQLLSATHAMAGLLWLELLDPYSAQEHAEKVRIISERIDSRFRIRMGSAILALSAIAREDFAAAEREIQLANISETTAETLAQFLIWRAAIELDLAQGNAQRALERVDLLLGSVPGARRERPALRTSFLRGQALNALERFEQAESWLVPARDTARDLNAFGLLWRIQHQLGHSYLGLRDRSSARDAFTEARQIVEDLSATIDSAETRSHFWTTATSSIPEPAGPTPLQVAKQSASGLTRRQRQVASLVAAGKSNRIIAETLSISERTVESHVSAILTTLNLESRAQIVAWCMENGLDTEPGLPA